MHAYHDKLPGYSPEQILHDGCAECEERGAVVYRAIHALDAHNYQRAKLRARTWNGVGLSNVSHAERVLLETLWAIHCQEETAAYISAARVSVDD